MFVKNSTCVWDDYEKYTIKAWQALNNKEHNDDYSLHFLLRTSDSTEMAMKFLNILIKISASDHKQKLVGFEIITILFPSTKVPKQLGQNFLNYKTQF